MPDQRRDGGKRKIRLALIFGGRSGEHEVSVVSARSVAGALDPDRYDVVPMAIDRRGRWADPDTAGRVLAASGNRVDRIEDFSGADALDPRLLDDGIDVAFPVLHGPFGEDGTIQGLFEILDLPYVGCGHASSAVCMDKAITKQLVSGAGLATPDWVVIDHRWVADPDRVITECAGLGLPVFVKPARLGSSVGISKVGEAARLQVAVEQAFEHDRKVIVERAVPAREIEVAVLGNSEPEASVPGEVIPGHEFYDYEDKYLDDSCQLLAPAPLDAELTAEARTMAVDTYRALECEGMARVDLFLNRGDGSLWVNEVNTIPGFTSISMYPRLWELTGLPYPQLLDELVRLAFERHSTRRTRAPEGQ
jgi:D-alanine-D-alanine ligase